MDRLDYFIETCEITAFRLSRHLHPTAILGEGAGSGRAPFSQSFFATREEPWGISAAHCEWGQFRKIFHAALLWLSETHLCFDLR